MLISFPSYDQIEFIIIILEPTEPTNNMWGGGERTKSKDLIVKSVDLSINKNKQIKTKPSPEKEY